MKGDKDTLILFTNKFWGRIFYFSEKKHEYYKTVSFNFL